MVVLRGSFDLTRLYAVPLAVALVSDAAVGIPRWLIYAPVVAWGVFMLAFLALALFLGTRRTEVS